LKADQLAVATIAETQHIGDNGSPRESATVLLVEDHESSRQVLERLLTRRGFRVTTAENVTDALARCAQGSFQLLISDIGLPDGDGYQVMRHFRQTQFGLGIAITGYGMEQDVQQGLDAGFTAHVVKPVTVAKLDAALGAVGIHAQQPPLTAGSTTKAQSAV
jgi:CheY-like chemotaxis protein